METYSKIVSLNFEELRMFKYIQVRSMISAHSPFKLASDPQLYTCRLFQ